MLAGMDSSEWDSWNAFDIGLFQSEIGGQDKETASSCDKTTFPWSQIECSDVNGAQFCAVVGGIAGLIGTIMVFFLFFPIAKMSAGQAMRYVRLMAIIFVGFGLLTLIVYGSIHDDLAANNNFEYSGGWVAYLFAWIFGVVVIVFSVPIGMGQRGAFSLSGDLAGASTGGTTTTKTTTTTTTSVNNAI